MSLFARRHLGALLALLLAACRPATEERAREAAPRTPAVTASADAALEVTGEAGAASPVAARPLPARERLLAPFRGTQAIGFVAVTQSDRASPSGATRLVLALPDGAPATDRPVLVASFTKMWIAVAALRLAARGELSLDAAIRDLVPDLARRPWADSTVRELLTHTSRVPEFDEKSGYYSRPDVDFTDPVVALAKWVPAAVVEKRGIYKYRNAELALVGAILAVRSGVPIGDLLAREVFGPAHMTASGVIVGRAPAAVDLAPVGRVRPQNFFTAGAGYASAVDLLAFFEALAGDTLLDATARAALFDGSAARGWGALGCWAFPFARADGGTTPLVERPGSFGNVRLSSAFFPEEGRAVVAWSSAPVDLGRPRSGRGIAFTLARTVLE